MTQESGRAGHEPVLEWIDFEGARHRHRVRAGVESLIGRDGACGVRFANLDVSRVHCALVATPAGWVVRDEGSRFGTWVNGVRLHDEHLLSHGDALGVGEGGRITLTFLERADEETSPATRARHPHAPMREPPYQVLWGVVRAMTSTLDLEVVLDRFLGAVLEIGGFEAGSLVLVGDEGLTEVPGRGPARRAPSPEALALAPKARLRRAVVIEAGDGADTWVRAAFPLRAFEGNRLLRDHATGGPEVIGVAVAEGRRGVDLGDEASIIQQLADLAAVHVANTRLYERARRDALTRLLNRGSFDRDLSEALDRAAARREPLGLALLDVDHFKSINDRFGHPAGDDVLRHVATLLRERAGQGVAYRYGGEEFAVIWPGLAAGAACAAAEDLRRAVEAAAIDAVRGGEPLRVTISAGVAAVPSEGISRASELTAAADRGLYESKNGGRNRVTPRPPEPGGA